MSNFKPSLRIITEETQQAYRLGKSKSQGKDVVYNTYRELKKNLKKHLGESLDPFIHISRSRAGEWGEWFEVWELSNGKPHKIKEGWM